MSQDSKFQQRWEFRRRDDDFDSSSNDEASSGIGPFLKKNKLVPNLISLEEDDPGNTQFSQHENQINGGDATAVPFRSQGAEKSEPVPSKKKREAKNKTKKSPAKRPPKKKISSDTIQALPLDGLKSFVKSIIQDLKVERESLFTRMKEDIMTNDKAPEPGPKNKRKAENSTKKVIRRPRKKKVEEPKKAQDCNGVGTSEQQTTNDKPVEPNNFTENVQEQVNDGQTAANESGENPKLPTEKSTYSPNTNGQLASSSNLDVATIPSEPRGENPEIASSYKFGPLLGKAGLGIDPSAHQRHFRGFSQTGSPNFGYFGQSNNVQSSSPGNSFAIHLQQAMRNGINIPSSLGHSTTDSSNNLLGLRMHGGAIRFSEGNNSFADQFISSNPRSQMNFMNGEGLLAFGNQEQKDRHLYSN